MAVSNEDILKWTLEGIDKGAVILLIIKEESNAKPCYFPRWVDPGESLASHRKMLHPTAMVVEDAVDLNLAKEYFSKTTAFT